MRAFYKQSLWILQNFLLTNPDLHHGLLATFESRRRARTSEMN